MAHQALRAGCAGRVPRPRAGHVPHRRRQRFRGARSHGDRVAPPRPVARQRAARCRGRVQQPRARRRSTRAPACGSTGSWTSTTTRYMRIASRAETATRASRATRPATSSSRCSARQRSTSQRCEELRRAQRARVRRGHQRETPSGTRPARRRRPRRPLDPSTGRARPRTHPRPRRPTRRPHPPHTRRDRPGTLNPLSSRAPGDRWGTAVRRRRRLCSPGPGNNGAPGGSPPKRESLTWGIHQSL